MNTSDLKLFVRTADTGNITAAAAQLEMSPAAASAALKRLEKQLGIELFIRSTRQLRITAEGERFLLHCRQALSSLDDAKASISEMKGEIAGEVRLSVSSDLGRNLILPWLDEVMDNNPKLSFQLSMGDSLADFYMDKVDVALRYGQPEDSTMVAFKLATVERVICASPDYIAAYGSPQKPEDLLQHNCLLYQLGSKTYNQWELISKNSEDTIDTKQHNEQSTDENSNTDDSIKSKYKIKVSSNRMCNDGDIVKRWALAGKGIALKSRLDLSRDLNAGRVVELMPNYYVEPTSLWLICPSRKQVTPAILLLRDLLREKCQALLATKKSAY
jgi:DNA-binding transcriptional LysR family regulator